MDVIVFGYVQRPETEAAFDRAIEEAQQRDAKLIVLHSSRGGANTDVDEVMAYREVFEGIDRRLADAGIEYELREYVRGRSVAEDVLELADETSADLIVIGLRRRSPVGKLLLGSHAQDIMLNARCPVLAIPAPDDLTT